MDRKPYVFLYGGYMNPETLKASGTSPEECVAGYVDNLMLTVGPIANLTEKDGSRAYGLLTRLSHDDLDTLYGGDPAALGGAVYLPEAVLVKTDDGLAVPALTYICPELSGDTPDLLYVAKLIAAAEAIGLPADYIDYIRTRL